MKTNKGRIPQVIADHRDADVWRNAWRRMHQKNQMFSAVVVGKPGSGKSWTAMSICELLDRTLESGNRFDLSRITFGAKEFADAVKKKKKMGSMFIVDDAGITVYSREAMIKTVRDITKIFQTIRFRNYGIILTLPSWSMLDKNIRWLVDAYIEMVEPGVFKYMWVKPNAYSGEVFRNYPIRMDTEEHPEGMSFRRPVKVKRFAVDKPSQELRGGYEKKKSDYMDKLYEEYARFMGMPRQKRFDITTDFVNRHWDDFLERDKTGKLSVSSWLIYESPQIAIDRPSASRIAQHLNAQLKKELKVVNEEVGSGDVHA